MRTILRDTSLSMVMFGLFLLCLVGHSLAGHADYNADQQAHQQEGLMQKKTMQLERRLLRMFPETDCEIAYAWAGTFGTTEDGLAYIGPSPEWAHAYFALGDGGYGITMSVIAAELIPDHYLGQHNPDAELFRVGVPNDR